MYIFPFEILVGMSISRCEYGVKDDIAPHFRRTTFCTSLVGFDVPTAEDIKVFVLWDTTPYNPFKVN